MRSGTIPVWILWFVTNKLFAIVPHVGQAKGMLEAGKLPAEMGLKHALLEHYDSTVRSTYNMSRPTDVSMELALQQIIDVDEKKQLLLSTVWIRLFWKDEFLTWNISDHEGIDHMKVNPKQIWIPDVCIYEALQPAVYATEMQDFYVNINGDGTIMWLAPLVITSVCNFNVRKFPYDTQSCQFTFGSWSYDGFSVDLYNHTPSGDVDSLHYNVEWNVLEFKVERIVHIFNCCPAPFPVIRYTLVMQRMPGFYVTYLYVPSVVIIASSLFAFHLPPGSEAKVDLAVTGLLSQTVFLLLISDLMPPDALNRPILGECLTSLLMVQAAAVIVIVIVKRVHDDSVFKTRPPPRWLYMTMHYLKYPFLLWHIEFRPADYQSITRSLFAKNGSLKNQVSDATTNPVSIKSVNINSQHLSNGTAHQHDNKDESAFKTIPQTVLRTISEILDELLTVRKKQEVESKQNTIADQWRNIAAMYDRVLFVCFAICILGITLWFLTSNN